MFRAPLCPSSGVREYYTDGRCLWYLVLWFSSCRYGVELRVMCPVCSLMMGIMVPETCWTSNKICNKYHLLHLVGILFPHIGTNIRFAAAKSLNVTNFRSKPHLLWQSVSFQDRSSNVLEYIYHRFFSSMSSSMWHIPGNLPLLRSLMQLLKSVTNVQKKRLMTSNIGYREVPSWFENYLLAPWSRILLEKLTGFQLVKKFLTFYGTEKFITAFPHTRHLSLPWVRSV